jgi:hypothetical protein
VTEVINEGASEMVSTAKLKVHPRNVNEGDLGAIDESIGENGFYGALVVQRSTGHVLVGNHRLKAARTRGIKQVPVIYVDVDDERAMKILLADNRTARLGYDDEAGLRDVLLELAEGPGLTGTGYSGDDLDDLIQKLGDGSHPYGPVQTPSDAGIDYLPQFGVIAICEDEAEQEKVYDQLLALGLTCRVVTT